MVKEQDTEDLVRAVRQFLEMPYEQKKQMGMAARAKMEREFDRKIVVDAYLKTIEENIK